MNDKEKYPTMDEREPSDCARRTEKGKGKRNQIKSCFWAGMNDRDETDPVTRKPMGRMISEGFQMLDDNDYPDE